MNTGRPYADAIPGARGHLLATLVRLETPVTVRALARHAGISPQGALGVVDDLSDAGLVLVERAGSALMVSLNREHLAAEPLIALVRRRQRLVERLTEELKPLRELSGAWLFGSMARGDGDRHSDVDLLLVAKDSTENPNWVEAIALLRQRVHAWTGNEVQLMEHTERSFARLVKTRNAIVAALRDDGIPLTTGSRLILRTTP